jgi:hypothetical protein
MLPLAAIDKLQGVEPVEPVGVLQKHPIIVRGGPLEK